MVLEAGSGKWEVNRFLSPCVLVFLVPCPLFLVNGSNVPRPSPQPMVAGSLICDI